MTDTCHLEPGDVIAEKYRVERVLGAGGMGVVLEATHLQLGERVAIKVVRKRDHDNDTRIARFLREARAAARIKSEHAVRVYDVGVLDDGSPFMVMEHLDGRDLSQHVKEQGPLAPEEAVEAVLQACEALATAHALDIVHRDIKPSNLFASERGGHRHVKVIDFGISKVPMRHELTQSEPDVAMTASNAMIGSPHYMAPEQMRSAKHVDARADVWSLGATLHTLLNGSTPFDGDSVMAIYEDILDGYRGFPTLRVATAPHEKIVRRCLERDPTLRFQNVAELAQALVPLAPVRSRHLLERIAHVLGAPSRAKPASLEIPAEPTESMSVPPLAEHEGGATAPAPEALRDATQEAWTRTEGKPPSRVLALALLVGGIGVGAWLATTRDTATSGTAAPTGSALLNEETERSASSSTVSPSPSLPVPSLASTASSLASVSPPAPGSVAAPPPPLPPRAARHGDHAQPAPTPAPAATKPKWDNPWP